MSCWRCDDIGQYETRTEPYTFTYQGRTIHKTRTYVSPCDACERGQRIAAARLQRGIYGDRQRQEGSAA